VVEALMHCPAAGEALQAALAALPDCEKLLPRTAQFFASVSAASCRRRPVVMCMVLRTGVQCIGVFVRGGPGVPLICTLIRC
jgi:hypothetical protein